MAVLGRIGFAATALVAAIGGVALAAPGTPRLGGVPSAPATTHLDFSTYRNGDEIGHHVVDITRQGDTVTVHIRTRWHVDIAFVTVYRFDHDSTEVWRGGRLMALDAQTNDDGTRYILHVTRSGDALDVVGSKDGQPIHGQMPDMPTSGLWAVNLARGPETFNTINGKAMKVSVQDLGVERIAIHGSDVVARHYHVSGDLTQDDWYDPNGNMVRKIAKAPDGSDIVLQLQ